ncbi:uncharacterized protein [Macaca nemestrina]|uniref:uncharacterized protein isoform X8 n=1 Tax=Macaca nemestrina TaxID=9545 RepID=UPI0039B82915
MVIDNEYSWLISMLLIRPLECNNIDFYIQLAKESCTTGQIGETPGENTATRHHLGSRQQPSPDTNCWFLNFGLLSLQKFQGGERDKSTDRISLCGTGQSAVVQSSVAAALTSHLSLLSSLDYRLGC